MDSSFLLKSFDDYFIDNNWNLEKIKKNFGGEIPTILTRVLKARSCSVDVVELLLKEGADINCQDDDGYSPLFIALAISNNEKVIRVLLEAGAEVNKVDGCGRTPLLSYLQREDCSVGIVEVLLDYKADVNRKNLCGDSPLATAIRKSKDDAVIRVLVERGAEVNDFRNLHNTPLFLLLRRQVRENCSADTVKLLLAKGANINCIDRFGLSPLMTALDEKRDEKVIQALLENGAEVNKVFGNQTPLSYHLRSSNCSIGIVKLLLCYKAEVNTMDCYGQFPLTTALSHSRDIEIIRMLLEEGADVNILDCSGESPLCIAFQHSSNDIVKLLLDVGSSPNKCKYHGSALICVTDFPYPGRSREDILKFLLEANIDVHSTGHYEQSFVCFALQQGAKAHDIQLLLDAGALLNTCMLHNSPMMCATNTIDCFSKAPPLREDVVQLLLNNGACVDDNSMSLLKDALCRNYETGAIQLLLDLPGMDAYVAANESLLHHAVMNPNCRLDVVELLLNRRAQVHSKNERGETPLHCAAGNERCEPKVINLLLKNGSPVNAINKYGETPLMLAVQRHCHSNILKELLLAGAHIGKSKFGHGWGYNCELLDFLASKWETCRKSKILESYKMLLKFFLLQNPKFELKNFHSSCFANSHPKLNIFLKECLTELEKMDLLQVVHGHTFRMFVSSDCLPVVKNYDIDQILIFLMENTFPVFIDVISARIGRSIMELAVKRLKVYIDKIHTMERVHLNCDVVFKISKYLSEDDLLKFILASDKPANKNDSGEAIKENSLPHKRNSESSAKLSKCRKLCS